VVKVIWHKTASPRQTDGSIVFARWRQCALPSGHIGASPGESDWNCAHWRHLANMIELRLPSAHPSPQPKRQINRFSSRQKVSILYNRRPFPPKLPLLMVGSGSLSNWRLLRPVQTHNPNGITIGSAVFTQVTVECSYTLQWDAPFPSKLPLPRGIWTPSNAWLPGPTRVLNPNGISIGSAVLQGSLLRQTDRPKNRQTDQQTDRQTTLLSR